MNDNFETIIKNILAGHSGESALNDTIAQKIAKALEDVLEVCTGCGHIRGDEWPKEKALACCPNSRYLPLRDFIADWHKRTTEQEMAIIQLINDIDGEEGYDGMMHSADFIANTVTFSLPKNIRQFSVRAGRYKIVRIKITDAICAVETCNRHCAKDSMLCSEHHGCDTNGRK